MSVPKFNLKRACKSCPFRKDRPFLTRGRAVEIANALRNDASFTCHNTLDYNVEDGPAYTEKSDWCAGSLAVMHNEGSTYDNVLLRLASQFMGYEPEELKDTDECFDNLDDFIEAQDR